MGSSRGARRLLIVSAIAALTTSFAALPVAGQEATDATDEPQGIEVPGLEVSAVSGNAFGGEVEFRIAGEAVPAMSLDVKALTDAITSGDGAAMHALLESAGITGSVDAAAFFEEQDEVGPDPEVELPPEGGGPLKDSEGSLKLTIEGSTFPVAEDLEVETEGATGSTGFARSEATAENVDALIAVADKIDTECSADLTGIRGSTRIEDGEFEDFDDFDGTGPPTIRDIPEHPDANEVLTDEDLEFDNGSGEHVRFKVFIVVNEQDEDANALTVTGLRVRVDVEVRDTSDPTLPVVFSEDLEASFAQSHCDLHVDPVVQVVEPKFTG